MRESGVIRVKEWTLKNLGLGEAAKRGVGTGADHLPDMSFFGANLSSNGYQSLPSGLIIQWGKVDIDYSSAHTAYIVAGGSVNKYSGTGNFPVTFPNAALVALGTSNDIHNAYISSIYISSPKGFAWSHYSTQLYATTGSGGNAFSWLALGY